MLINHNDEFHFMAPEFLKLEIGKHYEKLSIILGLTIAEIKISEN